MKRFRWALLGFLVLSLSGCTFDPDPREIDFGRVLAARVSARYRQQTGRSVKITGIQIGYESRCAMPHAFDVMLGSQLGVGAYRALCEENLDGHMVSVKGQLDLTYVPFSELIHPDTLETDVRFVRVGSDFHRLAHQIETHVEHVSIRPPG